MNDTITPPKGLEALSPGLADALAAHRAIPRERPARRRPNRASVEKMLAMNGKHVTITEHHFTQDVDGLPLGVENETNEATFAVSLELLGWTQAEWDDLTITE